MELPSAYLAYLEDPECVVEGFREGIMPGYFALWPPDEIEQNNREYEVPASAPGFLGFGSNGGGELLAFDMAGAVYLLSMIGLSSKDAIMVSGSWQAFTAQITSAA